MEEIVIADYLTVNVDALSAYTTELFAGMGLTRENAEIEADSLIWANVRGIDSHGVQRIELLSHLLQTGGMKVDFEFKVLSERAGTILIDADRAPGAISATHAMSGLAFMFECLTGIMSGNPLVAPWLNSSDESIRRHTQNSIMAAIDIAAFTDPDIFAERVDELIEAVKGLPKAEGFDEIYVPGEIEENYTRDRLVTGIPLPPGTVDKLIDAGKTYGVKIPDWLTV